MELLRKLSDDVSFQNESLKTQIQNEIKDFQEAFTITLAEEEEKMDFATRILELFDQLRNNLESEVFEEPQNEENQIYEQNPSNEFVRDAYKSTFDFFSQRSINDVLYQSPVTSIVRGTKTEYTAFIKKRAEERSLKE